MYKIKRGVEIMKYKVLEREDYAEELDFHFYIDKCEDASGNIVYCLVARALRSKEEIYLFENSDFITFTQINQEIKEFLLNNIVEYLRVQVDFYNIENIKIKQLEDGIKINNKVFEITKYHDSNDYDALYEDTTNYIIDTWETKEYGSVLKWD